MADTCYMKLNIPVRWKPLLLHKALFVEHGQLGKSDASFL